MADEDKEDEPPPAAFPIDGLYRRARVPSYTRAEMEEQDAQDRQANEAEPDTLKETEAAAKEAAIDDIYEWFNSNFEDPSFQTPSINGDYIYQYGGPFDANDVIWEIFETEYKTEWIEEAVDLIQADGPVDWAPKSSGEYYKIPVEEDEPLTERASTKLSILSGVGELRKTLVELPTRPDAVGHNGPPVDIGLPPYSEKDKKDIDVLLIDVEDAVSDENQDATTLEKLAQKLMDYGSRALTYAGQKADLAVDETIKTGIKAGSGAGLFYLFGNDAVALAKSILNFAEKLL